MSKVVKFFLRCDPDAKYFYSVEFHPDKRSMLRSIRRLEGSSRHASDSRAVCLRFTLKEPHPKHEQIGTLFFLRHDSAPDVVMHELFHAALGWARRVGIDNFGPRKRYRYLDDPEERVARQMQYLVSQFYLEAPRHLAEQESPKAA